MKNIIVDTDLGYDVDDAAALAVINVLHRQKLLRFCAATHCFSHQKAADAVRWINEHYQVVVPVGLAREKKDKKCLERFICKLRFPKSEEYMPAVDVMKNALSLCEEQSAVLLCIGQLNNLRDLLRDEMGAKLLREKVCEIVVMGGYFAPYGEYYEYGGVRWKGEFNIITDLPAAQEVTAETDLPLSFIDFNQGVDVRLDVDEISLPEKHPVDIIYRTANMPKRSSWDVEAALYASGEYAEYFSLSKYGKVSVDDNGKTAFQIGSGRHRLVTLKHEHKVMECLIREFFLKQN